MKREDIAALIDSKARIIDLDGSTTFTLEGPGVSKLKAMVIHSPDVFSAVGYTYVCNHLGSLPFYFGKDTLSVSFRKGTQVIFE
jgi:hypothetical protein